jgi:hypothetical protein
VAAIHGGSAGLANAKHDSILHGGDPFYEIPTKFIANKSQTLSCKNL